MSSTYKKEYGLKIENVTEELLVDNIYIVT